MSKLLSASIDLAKIDKSKIKVSDKGQKFLNIDIWINDEPNQWGQNVSINIQQSKEERERKVKKVYIGNGKSMDQFATTSATVNVTPSQPNNSKSIDDLF